jgi:hypothetical protein
MHDRGRLLDLGQVDDRELVVRAGLGVDREDSVDEDPVSTKSLSATMRLSRDSCWAAYERYPVA